MAYIKQEEKSVIAENIKSILKKYPDIKIKYSLRIKDLSTIIMTISQANVNFQEYCGKEYAGIDINQPYEIQNVMPQFYTGIAGEFLTEIHKALHGPKWYNNSDTQTDYFDIKHYVRLSFGKWNKPFFVVE